MRNAEVEFNLTKPQTDMFLKTCPYPLFSAGFGTGKSFTLVVCALRDLLQYRGANIGIYSPTYDLNRLNLIPRFTEILESQGMSYTYNKSTSIISVSGYGDLIFRSMDNPSKIIAYETFRSHCDEIDTLKLDKAQEVWNKVIARNRQVVTGSDASNRVSAYSTPEGFNFTYQQWSKSKADGYEYVQAATYSNPHLPETYIENLRSTYPPELVDAYISGSWTNLKSGTVYKNYDRTACNSNETIREKEPLFVGMDFNVTKMAATIYVKRKGGREWHAVDEIVDGYDTPEMITILKERYDGHEITVYPDSSGKNRKSVGASTSDIALLKGHFKIRVRPSNPFVKDRVLAVNAAFNNGIVRVNADKCPNVADCLEQQVYDKNGEPDKKSGKDHMCDSFGYLIAYEFPVRKPTIIKNSLAIGF